jgi:sugar-phosphatase
MSAGMQVVALLTTVPEQHLKHRPLIRDFRDVRIQPDADYRAISFRYCSTSARIARV